MYRLNSLQDKKSGGFTLVELMIVIGIIGLLSVVLVPKIGRAKDAAKNAGVEANMKTAMSEILLIIDNYSNPLDLEMAIQQRLNHLLTNPYNGQTAAVRWYDNGRGGGDQWNNSNAALKSHYYGPNAALHSLAQNDIWFAQGSEVRSNCAGMVVLGITYVNNVPGVAIYGYDGAGNPMTPSAKALRISQ